MLYNPFTQLSLAALTTEYSQALGMGDFNASELNMVITYIQTAAAPTIVVQISNDMENWVDKATVTWNTTASAVGSYVQTSATTGIGTAFMRVKVSTAASGAAIMAIGANLSKQ